MRIFYRTVQCLLALLLTVACQNPVEPVKTPSYEAPESFRDIDKILASLRACAKPESEVVGPEKVYKKNLKISAQIESQDTEETDCQGKVTTKTKEPVREFNEFVNIPAPVELKGPVNFVKVESPRTCGMDTFDAHEKTPKIVEKEDGTILTLPDLFSEAYPDGEVRLKLTDSVMKLMFSSNIVEGKNPLIITYYGKCLKYKDQKEERLKDEFYLCEDAEVLGSQEVLVEIYIDRPEIPGVRKINTCRN